MSYIFIGGFCLGLTIPSFLKDENYTILYHGIYRPHRMFFTKRRELFKNQQALRPEDYYEYILDSTLSFFNIFYMLLIGKRNNFIFLKQQNCFNLIEEFEFMNETLKNMDYIQESLQKKSNLFPGSYQHLAILEEGMKKMKVKSVDEINAENILKIKEMSVDPYEQYLLESAVETKENYYKNMPFNKLIDSEMQKHKIQEAYAQSQKQWEDKLKVKNIDHSIHKNQNAISQVVTKKQLIQSNMFNKTPDDDKKENKVEKKMDPDHKKMMDGLKEMFEK